MKIYPQPPDWVGTALRRGLTIPAHPLALNKQRRLDERHQRALTRYYHAAGAGGIAVGVHTTQFEIRQPQYGLYQPVLQLAAETIAACDAATGRRTVRIAGICGPTRQAVTEAKFARITNYHAGLLSLAAMKNADNNVLLKHCQTVAQEIPLIGFYLQPAAGGRILPYSFWRRFAEIPNVIAIKMAPFNRYQTFDVVRAVAEAGRDDLALYTGNDDNIVMDLLTPYRLRVGSKLVERRIVGGLLGHWAVWTKRAVELLAECRKGARSGKPVPVELLQRNVETTDANAAFFDVANGFAECIPGIHEVLRRQGLLKGGWCLNPKEQLSPGQKKEIDRIYRAYPHLNDDQFVSENLDKWLR